MKTITSLLICLLCFPTSTILAQDIAGQWVGHLDVQGTQLELVFHITKTENGFASTVDSPDQGVTGIPVTSTTVEQNKIYLVLSRMQAKYEGVVSGRSMEGTWRQAGRSFPLNLTKGARAIPERKKRPQEPSAPYPYHVEEVVFENAEAQVKLAGTLTLPDTPGPHPAVVLISGSGPQNRDEEVFGHKPFLVLADHLTRQGIAVLRYDDRGVYQSTGNFPDATTADFATDAASAVAHLKTRKEIDPNQIGLIGHSEGGIIAPLAANQTQDVAFIVSLAGSGIRGADLLAHRANLIRPFDVPDEAAYERFVRAGLQILTSDQSVEEMQRELTAHYRGAADFLKMMVPEGTDVDAFIGRTVAAETSPWSRYFYTYNPADELEKITIPVLVLHGSLDVQVPPEVNQRAIRAALEKAGNEDFTIKTLPGLNHFFQESGTGAMSEYSKIEQTFSPIALDEIAIWIHAHTQR